LGGLIFWFLGIPSVLLWAVVMTFLSLLPAVGAALIWTPVAIYFLLNDQVWQGVLLILYGVCVIGLVDNLLRPILVGKDTKMPDYMVLISTLGGLALFGLNGFVIGPLVAALFMSSWGLFTEQEVDEEESAQKPAAGASTSSGCGYTPSTKDSTAMASSMMPPARWGQLMGGSRRFMPGSTRYRVTITRR